jgi:hypothetical protein
MLDTTSATTTTDSATLAAQTFLKAQVPEGPIAASLKRQIESEVSAIVQDGHTVALLGVATESGWKVTGAVRVGKSGRFQLSGDVGQAWGGRVTGRVGVLYTM